MKQTKSNKYNSKDYKIWREKVFKRDLYSCRLCGKKGSIQAHHILRKHDYPHLTLQLSNGISLCTQCHYVVTGRERVFERLFQHIIANTLSIDFVYKFFYRLTVQHVRAVSLFKKYNTWDSIPDKLIKTIKIQKAIKELHGNSIR